MPRPRLRRSLRYKLALWTRSQITTIESWYSTLLYFDACRTVMKVHATTSENEFIILFNNAEAERKVERNVDERSGSIYALPWSRSILESFSTRRLISPYRAHD